MGFELSGLDPDILTNSLAAPLCCWSLDRMSGVFKPLGHSVEELLVDWNTGVGFSIPTLGMTIYGSSRSARSLESIIDPF